MSVANEVVRRSRNWARSVQLKIDCQIMLHEAMGWGRCNQLCQQNLPALQNRPVVSIISTWLLHGTDTAHGYALHTCYCE